MAYFSTWRSNAATIGWGNWEIGTNLRNNERPFPDDDSDHVDLSGTNLLGKTNKNGKGAWKNGKVYSSPLWFGYRNGSNVTRIGFSHKMVQDRTQNWVHRNGFFYMPFGRANYFNDYSEFKTGGYSYSGYNNPYSLW